MKYYQLSKQYHFAIEVITDLNFEVSHEKISFYENAHPRSNPERGLGIPLGNLYPGKGKLLI